MKLYLSIFVIAIVVSHEANSQEVEGNRHRRCTEREKFNKCGTSCPLTCENHRRPPQACTEICVRGCFCISPYVRNKEGECVHPSECRKITEPQEATCSCRRPHEVYKSCGSLCPRTCANRALSNICAAGCQAGCFCDSGYLRNRRNECVPERDCH